MTKNLSANEQDKLVMGAVHLPPYFIVSPDEDKVTGLIPELLTPVFLPLNINVQYKVLPLERVKLELVNGTIDAFPLVNMANNNNKVLLTDVYLSANDYVWTTRSKFPKGIQWETYSDLKNYRIGIVFGAGYGVKTNEFIANNNDIFYKADSSPLNIKLLLSGRLDAIFSNEDIILAHNESEKLVSSKKPLFINQYKIAFSLRSKFASQIEEFNQKIATFQKSHANKTKKG